MVRGVNKTVIEILSTDSGYFERAILFVNPEHSHMSQKRLKSEAEKYVDMIKSDMTVGCVPSKVPKTKSSKGLLRDRLRALAVLMLAVTVAAGILFVILNNL